MKKFKQYAIGNRFKKALPIILCICAVLTLEFSLIIGGWLTNIGWSSAHEILRCNWTVFRGYGLAVVLAPLIVLNLYYWTASPHRRILAIVTVVIGYLVCFRGGMNEGGMWLLSAEDVSYQEFQYYKTYYMIVLASFIVQAFVTLNLCCREIDDNDERDFRIVDDFSVQGALREYRILQVVLAHFQISFDQLTEDKGAQMYGVYLLSKLGNMSEEDIARTLDCADDEVHRMRLEGEKQYHLDRGFRHQINTLVAIIDRQINSTDDQV